MTAAGETEGRQRDRVAMKENCFMTGEVRKGNQKVSGAARIYAISSHLSTNNFASLVRYSGVADIVLIR